MYLKSAHVNAILDGRGPRWCNWRGILYNHNKHETLIQCCFNVGPVSKTMGQYWNNTGSRVFWDVISNNLFSLNWATFSENKMLVKSATELDFLIGPTYFGKQHCLLYFWPDSSFFSPLFIHRFTDAFLSNNVLGIQHWRNVHTMFLV